MDDLLPEEVPAIRDRMMANWAESREKTRAALSDIPTDCPYLQPAGRAASLGNITRHMIRAIHGLMNGLAGRDWDENNELAPGTSLPELLATYEAANAAALARLPDYSDEVWQIEQGEDRWGNPLTLEKTLRRLILHDPYHRGQIHYARNLLTIGDTEPEPLAPHEPRAAGEDEQAAIRHYMLEWWEEIHDQTIEVVKDVPAEQLYLRPLDHAASIGQMLWHLTNTQVSWSNYLRTGVYEGIYLAQDAPPTALINEHEFTHRDCRSQSYALDISRWRTPEAHPHLTDRTITPEWMIWHLLEHEMYHLGQIIYAKQVLGIEVS